jgi:hypothetical protein
MQGKGKRTWLLAVCVEKRIWNKDILSMLFRTCFTNGGSHDKLLKYRDDVCFAEYTLSAQGAADDQWRKMNEIRQ